MARRRRRARTGSARKVRDPWSFCIALERACEIPPTATGLYGNLIGCAPNEAVRERIRCLKADEAMNERILTAIRERFGC